MTRDEILNMPAGAEMDMLIAENIFGWKDCTLKRLHGENVPTGKEPTENGYSIDYVPAYSIAISEAWEVVEKMLRDEDGKENKFHLFRYGFGVKKPRIRWRVSWGPGWANLLPQVDADTAPLAICRAALLAVLGG